jgi:hypothetical protein
MIDSKKAPGLSYSEAKTIMTKGLNAKINPNARTALLNSVKLKEGHESARNLAMETMESYKGIKGLREFNPRAGRGNGNRAVGGLGDPKKCSLKEGFERVGPSTYKKVYGK